MVQPVAETCRTHPAWDSGNHCFRSKERLYQELLAGAPAGFVSQWCEPIGLAAIGDTFLTWKHADIARQEYLAVGIRVALHLWLIWLQSPAGRASTELSVRMLPWLPDGICLYQRISGRQYRPVERSLHDQTLQWGRAPERRS